MARARKAPETGSAPGRAEEPPDRRAVTARQAEYLAELTGVEAKQLAGRPLGELGDVLRWKIGPSLLLFRRVCGRVVRVDPGTGILQGVPNATVHVEGTGSTGVAFEKTWSFTTGKAIYRGKPLD